MAAAQPPPPKSGCFRTSAVIYEENRLWLRTRSLEKSFGSEMSGDFPKVTEPGEGSLLLPAFHAPSEEHSQGQGSGSQWAWGRQISN